MSILDYVKDAFDHPEKYAKFWVAEAGVLGVLLFSLAPTSSDIAFMVSVNEWYLILVAQCSAIGVVATPNKLKGNV